jgi:hypothetical protein
MDFIKEKFASKKIRALVLGILSLGLQFFGVDEDTSLKLTGLFSAYIVGQGIADAGKEAVKVQAQIDG